MQNAPLAALTVYNLLLIYWDVQTVTATGFTDKGYNKDSNMEQKQRVFLMAKLVENHLKTTKIGDDNKAKPGSSEHTTGSIVKQYFSICKLTDH